MHFEKNYYEQQNIWALPPLAYQKNILQDILSLIPSDTTSILDVGCGDGYITNNLPEQMKVMGVDWSQSALQHVRRETLVSDVSDIALPSKSFDLVMSNDVLEHIGDDQITKIIGEIERIANKYILISLPFEEWYNNNFTTCMSCGTEYHINLHKRSYNLHKMINIFQSFPDWVVTDVCFSGEEYSREQILDEFIRNSMDMKRSNPDVICPQCGSACNSTLEAGNVAISPAKILHPLIEKDFKNVCARNECIILLTKKADHDTTVASGFSFFNHNDNTLTDSAVEPAVLTAATGQHLKSEFQNLSLVIKSNNVKFHMPRIAQHIDKDGVMKIPEWVLYQIFRCYHKDIYSINAIAQHKQFLLNHYISSKNTEGNLDFSEQLKIDLQNARAELDLLKLRSGQAEQQAIDLQNARAELDLLKLKSNQAEQLAVDLQNVRAELDHFKLRSGQAEQLAIDLQNARAELDALKTKKSRFL